MMREAAVKLKKQEGGMAGRYEVRVDGNLDAIFSDRESAEEHVRNLEEFDGADPDTVEILTIQ